LEINPRHPLIKELLKRVEANPEDPVSKNMALMMFQTGMWHIFIFNQNVHLLSYFILKFYSHSSIGLYAAGC